MKKFFLLIIFFSIFFVADVFAAKSLYLSYKEVPKKVYKNQRFKVVVKALITTENFDYLSSSFSNSKNILLLNPNDKWEKVSSDTYENIYYFKVKTNKFQLPNITVNLVKNGINIDTTQLNNPEILYSEIAKGDKRFSGIIVSEIMLKAHKTKQYNNKEALTVIDLEAKDSNLESFNIQGLREQGLSKLNDNYPNQNLIYYFVTPVHKKKLVVTYYNIVTKNFKELVIPLVLQNELVSTQTDLNPNDSSFEKYKKIAVLLAFIIFLILFIWKRKKIILFIAITFLIFSIVYWMPNSTGIVKKDSYIYILPTKNSTIFFKLNEEQKVEKLQKQNGFIKVIGIDKQFIGWVKEDSFGKN